MDSKDLAGQIRAELARRRMTYIDLSAILDVRRQTVSRWLSGYSSIDMHDLYRICDALNMTVTELIRRAAEANTEAA